MDWFGRWRKRADVSAHSNSLASPPKCSTCLEPLYVMLRTPVELAPGFDRITYKCVTCGVAETRAAQRLPVAFESQSQVAQAARDNDGDPTKPHWRTPAANHNRPTHVNSQGL